MQSTYTNGELLFVSRLFMFVVLVGPSFRSPSCLFSFLVRLFFPFLNLLFFYFISSPLPLFLSIFRAVSRPLSRSLVRPPLASTLLFLQISKHSNRFQNPAHRKILVSLHVASPGCIYICMYLLLLATARDAETCKSTRFENTGVHQSFRQDPPNLKHETPTIFQLLNLFFSFLLFLIMLITCFFTIFFSFVFDRNDEPKIYNNFKLKLKVIIDYNE